jgi:hypothetical protein
MEAQKHPSAYFYFLTLNEEKRRFILPFMREVKSVKILTRIIGEKMVP